MALTVYEASGLGYVPETQDDVPVVPEAQVFDLAAERLARRPDIEAGMALTAIVEAYGEPAVDGGELTIVRGQE